MTPDIKIFTFKIFFKKCYKNTKNAFFAYIQSNCGSKEYQRISLKLFIQVS